MLLYIIFIFCQILEMYISLSRVFSSCSVVIKNAPLQVLFLVAIFVWWMDLIWERGLFWTTEDEKSSLVLWLLCLWAGTLRTISRQKSPAGSNYIKLIGNSIILLCLCIARWVFAPIPSMSQWVSLWIIWSMWIIWLVWISLIWTSREDSAVHHRLLDLIEQWIISWWSIVVCSWWLSLALLAIESLFWTHIPSERYPTIWLVCLLFLWSTSFLEWIISGNLMRSEVFIPKWKKLFAWIIWWLLIVFWVILYIYMWKILITWQRPSNEVTFRALRYSGLVIAASVILLPVRQGENEKMYKLRRGLYMSIIPMCIMIFFAIKLRVEQYWITVERYLVIAICVWLTVVSIRLSLKPRGKIWWLFISVIAVWLWSIGAWPWNAQWVSLKSQKNRLISLLEESNQFSEKWLILPLAWVTTDEKSNISGIVSYLVWYHDKNLSRLDPRLNDKNTIFELLWIEQVRWWLWFIPIGPDTQTMKYVSTTYWWKTDITWYETLYSDIHFSNNQDISFFWDKSSLIWSMNNNIITLSIDWIWKVSFDVSEHARLWSSLPQDAELDPNSMYIEFDTIKIYIHSAGLQKTWESRIVDHMNGIMLTSSK